MVYLLYEVTSLWNNISQSLRLLGWGRGDNLNKYHITSIKNILISTIILINNNNNRN